MMEVLPNRLAGGRKQNPAYRPAAFFELEKTT